MGQGGQNCAKPRPQMLERGERKASVEALDRAESKQVKRRSGGTCEVVVQELCYLNHWILSRCQRRATHVHHMLGGWGRRARGPSALAVHKQHVCPECHAEITGHVLKLLTGWDVPRFDMPYERVT